MSMLTLVRHGQASFFADDYDQLSAVGQQQMNLLGEHWARQRIVFDKVYTGPRARHRQSAELTGTSYRRSGLAWPDPIVSDDLDEYDLDGLLRRLAPKLIGQNAEFAQLAESYRRSVEDQDRLRSFQRMFESLLTHWQRMESMDIGLESWPAFRLRVERVILRMQALPGHGRRVALFTSGGFIGGTLQRALAASDQTALELNWRIRNSSLTEFVFTSERFTLDSFNAVPHLQDPALWTYR